MNYRFQKKLQGWQLVNEQGNVVYHIVKEIWRTGIDITDVNGSLVGQSRIVNDHEHRFYRYDETSGQEHVDATLCYEQDVKLYRCSAPVELIVSYPDILHVYVVKNDYAVVEKSTWEWIRKASIFDYECDSDMSALLLSILFSFTMFLRQEQQILLV